MRAYIKRLNWFQYLMIGLIALIIFRNSVFFEFEVVGTYISNAEEPTLEMPGKGAELYLYKDGTYSSNSFMGEGSYKIDGNVVDLSNGMRGWYLPLARKYNIGKPMILISADHGYYFIKE